MQLVNYGKKIIARRNQFIMELNEVVHDIHYKISGGREEMVIKYEPNIEDIFFEDELIRAKEKDLKYAQTSVGPHRDDLKEILFSVAEIIRNQISRADHS